MATSYISIVGSNLTITHIGFDGTTRDVSGSVVVLVNSLDFYLRCVSSEDYNVTWELPTLSFAQLAQRNHVC